MDIKEIEIIGGVGKNGSREPVEKVKLKMGDIVSIVGPTGSGKTEFINDIERFANKNTPSNRTVIIDGKTVSEELIGDPSKNPVALITQHTNFLSDLPVSEFLQVHANIRQGINTDKIVKDTLEFANQLTGESIILDNAMTELSGGQTRSLLIADAVIIGNSPIILLDEIENAGIHRTRALELLRNYRKIFFFVTHDPRIALLSDFRIVMKGGAMQKLIMRGEKEQKVADHIKNIDEVLSDYRAKIREGEEFDEEGFKKKMKAFGYISQ
jgi:ABC-type lipoprotein export system ATPase subunit